MWPWPLANCKPFLIHWVHVCTLETCISTSSSSELKSNQESKSLVRCLRSFENGRCCSDSRGSSCRSRDVWSWSSWEDPKSLQEVKRLRWEHRQGDLYRELVGWNHLSSSLHFGLDGFLTPNCKIWRFFLRTHTRVYCMYACVYITHIFMYIDI